MREAYGGFLERFRRELAAAVAAIANADATVVIHCQGGRDRTGLACGLMLRLVGVPLEAVAADHALSDEHLAPHIQDWHAEAHTEWERERRRRVTEPAGTTMAEVLADLDARGYLLAGGATTPDLDKLVLRLARE